MIYPKQLHLFLFLFETAQYAVLTTAYSIAETIFTSIIRQLSSLATWADGTANRTKFKTNKNKTEIDTKRKEGKIIIIQRIFSAPADLKEFCRHTGEQAHALF